MMPRKRTHDEMVAVEPPTTPTPNTMLHKLRNLWEFAALHEYLRIFGAIIKVTDLDIEDLEYECIKPDRSHLLEELGFKLVNWMSSRRDITMDNWDVNVRRQFEYRSPKYNHPYGSNEDEPNHFRDFHVFTKIRVLHQLTVLTFWNPEKLRSHFPNTAKEGEQFDDWNMHPVGWDRHDRQYYLFNGQRLYRRTDPPIEEPTKVKPKYTSKKAQAQRRKERSSKRRKVVQSDADDTEMGEGDDTMNGSQVGDDTTIPPAEEEDDPEKVNTFGDFKWECVAVNLEEYNAFLATIAKTKDPNEKNLRALVEEDVLAELRKQDEKRLAKEQQRLREIQLQEKMQYAKRSSRLAGKQAAEEERKKQEEEDRHRKEMLALAAKEAEEQEKAANERKHRIMTREQRNIDREMRRVLLEEELARESEEEKKLDDAGGRGARQLKERIKQKKQELEEWAEEEEWTFDCSGCGQHGQNFDDGAHSIACERCNIWQHSKCLGFSQKSAESENFHFVCQDCKRKEEEANRPKISLKFKVGQSSSPPQPTSPTAVKAESPTRQRMVSVEVPPLPLNAPRRPSAPGVVINGQFYPAVDPARPSHPIPSPSPPALAQPSMPAYAMKNAPRPMPYMNGVAPYAYNTFNAYPPQDRLPGGYHTQNLYNQMPPTNQLQYPQPTASQSPHLPPQPGYRPTSNHSQTPRPPSAHSQTNGNSSPVRQRLASPIINKPTMSPTQGNPDVGPIAGVPGSSPIMRPVSTTTPYTNGHYRNGSHTQTTPYQQPMSQNSSFSATQSSTAQPMSGLSPTKQRVSLSPLPQPTLVPQKQSAYQTPSSSFNNGQAMRSISGTPIFPPAENLAPSPQQLNKEPVPTPSKQTPAEAHQPQIQTFVPNTVVASQPHLQQEETSQSPQQPQQTQTQPQPGAVQ